MTNFIRRSKVTVSAMLILGGLILGHSAFAISVGGDSGYANFASGVPCFSILGAQVQYTGGCGNTQFWTIPLPVNQGTRSVAISATNNSSLNCSLCATDQSGNAISCSTPTFPAGTSVQTPSVTVPSNGAMYLQCVMGANSLINTLNYNQ